MGVSDRSAIGRMTAVMSGSVSAWFHIPMAHCSSIAQPHDAGLSRLLAAWLFVGLTCMLGPGVLIGLASALGVNLSPLPAFGSPEWIRHHAHAQIFGWIGSFVWGISLYAVPRLRNAQLCLSRAWTAWMLWTAGLAAFFSAPLVEGPWLEPAGLSLQSAGALLVTLEILPLHRRAYEGLHACLPVIATGAWIFVLSLLLETWRLIASLTIPAALVPSRSTVLLVALWGGLATITWGYASRWLPAIMNLRPPRQTLYGAVAALQALATLLILLRMHAAGLFLVLGAAITFIVAVRVFEPLAGAPRIRGVHPSFPSVVRLAHGWMALAALLTFLTFAQGATFWSPTARHLLTVGYLATMIAAIGSRMLPAFIGRIRLFSKGLMGASLACLSTGVMMRVINMFAATTGAAPGTQSWFPWFASLEVAGLLLFVANGLATVMFVPTVQESLAAAAARGGADEQAVDRRLALPAARTRIG